MEESFVLVNVIVFYTRETEQNYMQCKKCVEMLLIILLAFLTPNGLCIFLSFSTLHLLAGNP
jgi:hypothetical protein